MLKYNFCPSKEIVLKLTSGQYSINNPVKFHLLDIKILPNSIYDDNYFITSKVILN